MAKDNYPSCVAFVRKQEGGNCDTPGDRGGRTGRGGITHTTYDAYRDGKGLPRQDVWRIADAEIADIYRTNYWNPIYGDRLPAGQDLALFDYAINSGPAKANRARLLAGDGDAPTLIRKICGERLSFMHALGSWRQFGGTWGRRVAECEALALQMAGALATSTADAAVEAASDHKRKSARNAFGGAGVVVAAHHFASASHTVLALIVAATVAATLAAAFNAWRHGQRADALATAVKQMQAALAAAAAAQIVAAGRVVEKENAIAAEQDALIAAKAAIVAASPTPVPPSQATKGTPEEAKR